MTDSHHLATLIREQFALSDVAVCAMRELAHGKPVGVERLAEMSGHGVDEVRAELDRHPGLDWNDRGELVGWGLTLRETPHRFSHAVADFRAEICALGSFFASPDAAATWLAAHPDGEVVPIAEDFATTYQAGIAVGWIASR